MKGRGGREREFHDLQAALPSEIAVFGLKIHSCLNTTSGDQLF